jgi:hypothetical protein
MRLLEHVPGRSRKQSHRELYPDARVLSIGSFSRLNLLFCALSRKDFIAQRWIRTLLHGQDTVGWHVLENIYRAAWPINLQCVNSGRGTLSKKEPKIILREIATAASHFIDLGVVSGCASHAGADPTTVGFHSYEPQLDPVIPIRAVRT